MKAIILSILMFLLGFIVSDISPREVLVTHPVENPETKIRGVMIVTKSRFEPFFNRNTISMISNNDWYTFCPLEHKESE